MPNASTRKPSNASRPPWRSPRRARSRRSPSSPATCTPSDRADMTSATLQSPRPASRSLDAKVEPINGFKTVPVGDGYQLASMRMALCQALYEEMKRDERVFVMGEEVAEYNGAYKVTKGLL